MYFFYGRHDGLYARVKCIQLDSKFVSFSLVWCLSLTAALTVGSERTNTVLTDIMNVAAVSTGRGITTRTIIGTVLCLPLQSVLALVLVLLAVALTPQSLTLSREFVIPLHFPALHAVTLTVKTGAGVQIGRTITGGVDPHTLPSLDTRRPRGAQGRPLKHLPHLKEPLFHLAEGRGHVHAVSLRALILSAAPAALEVEG